MALNDTQEAALVAAAQHINEHGGEVPEELRCLYPSKYCTNVRSIKRIGGLHRLCEAHRKQQNRNQRLVDQRRRARIPSGNTTPPSQAGLAFEGQQQGDYAQQELRGHGGIILPALKDQDLEYLGALLDDDEVDDFNLIALEFNKSPH